LSIFAVRPLPTGVSLITLLPPLIGGCGLVEKVEIASSLRSSQ
jgi:hypothetical protein